MSGGFGGHRRAYEGELGIGGLLSGALGLGWNRIRAFGMGMGFGGGMKKT